MSEYDISNEVYHTNITWILNTAILPPAFTTAIDSFCGYSTEVRERGGYLPSILSDGFQFDESQCVPAEVSIANLVGLPFWL